MRTLGAGCAFLLGPFLALACSSILGIKDLPVADSALDGGSDAEGTASDTGDGDDLRTDAAGEAAVGSMEAGLIAPGVDATADVAVIPEAAVSDGTPTLEAAASCTEGATQCTSGSLGVETCTGGAWSLTSVCSGGQSCVQGSCVCPSGETSCGGSCVNLQTDNTHCGTCLDQCAQGSASCVHGNCVAN